MGLQTFGEYSCDGSGGRLLDSSSLGALVGLQTFGEYCCDGSGGRILDSSSLGALVGLQTFGECVPFATDFSAVIQPVLSPCNHACV